MRRRFGCAVAVHPLVSVRDATLALADETRNACCSTRRRHRAFRSYRISARVGGIRDRSKSLTALMDHLEQSIR